LTFALENIAMSGKNPAGTVRNNSGRSLARILVAALLLLFFIVRIVTSGPPATLDADTALGGQTGQSHLGLTAVGLVLLVVATVLEPPIGFAVTICDMNGVGDFFDHDQWGVPGVFKFRDLELGGLLAGATFLGLLRQRRRRLTHFSRSLLWIAWSIALVAIVYTLRTLDHQSLSTTVRYSRQLYVWLLLAAAPAFIKNRGDLLRAAGVFIAWAAVAAALYLAQVMLPPQTVLRYSQQMIYGQQTRIWSASLSPVFIGGLVIIAYQLQRRRSAVWPWMLATLCTLAIVASQGRMLTGVFVLSAITLAVYQSVRTGRVHALFRLGAGCAAGFSLVVLILQGTGRLQPLLNSWQARMAELEVDRDQGEGSLSARTDMFRYLRYVETNNGGTGMNLVFGMGLRALSPAQLKPMQFWGDITPPIWADNGLAGVAFSAGVVGLLLLIGFFIVILIRIAAQLRETNDRFARACLLAAFVYFLYSLPYMYFSAHFLGSFDEALCIVTVLVLAERSITFSAEVRRNGLVTA
jgi:O-antigen ligase